MSAALLGEENPVQYVRIRTAVLDAPQDLAVQGLEDLVERIGGNLADPAPEKVGLDGFERLDHLLVADSSTAPVFE